MKEGGEETAWDAAAALQSDRSPDTRVDPLNLKVFKSDCFLGLRIFCKCLPERYTDSAVRNFVYHHIESADDR